MTAGAQAMPARQTGGSQRPLDEGIVPALLPPALVWTLAVLMFVLTASNGVPYRISSGFYVVLIAPLVIFARGPATVLRAAETGPSRTIFYALLMFGAANLASTAITPNADTMSGLLERSLLPILVYLSMIGIGLSRRDQRLFSLAVCVGGLIMFVRGALAYYAEFGIPNLSTILWSRYQVDRIAGFETATVGNVTHMGSYVALLLPMLIVALVKLEPSRSQKALIWATLVLGLANLVVAGSRAGMIVVIGMSAILIYCFASRRTLIRLALAAAVIATIVTLSGLTAGNSEIVERFVPSAAGHVDGSVVERLDSMVIGWNVFLDNPLFGVGPEMSPQFNIYGIPHMSILHQLSELGLFGGLAFTWLNIVVLNAFRKAVLQASRGQGYFELLWLIGPAAWLAVGLFSGIVFNMSPALVWVGISHGMLALSAAHIHADEAPRPALSIVRVLKSLRHA